MQVDSDHPQAALHGRGSHVRPRSMSTVASFGVSLAVVCFLEPRAGALLFAVDALAASGQPPKANTTYDIPRRPSYRITSARLLSRLF